MNALANVPERPFAFLMVISLYPKTAAESMVIYRCIKFGFTQMLVSTVILAPKSIVNPDLKPKPVISTAMLVPITPFAGVSSDISGGPPPRTS